MSRADNNNVIFQTNTIDAFGHFSNYNLGNNINVHKTYTDFGYASHYAAQGVNAIQDYDFTFDPLTGNLSSRSDNLHGQYENFGYDVNDRLKTVSGSSALSMNYYPNGNIQNKSDVGNYTYDPTKVNALTQVTNPNGNISSNTQTVDYTSFNKTRTVKEIDLNTPPNTLNEVDYTYNPFQQRCKSILYGPGGSPISTTYYQQNYEKTLSSNGTNFTETSYINGGDGLNALFINDDAGQGKLYFVFTDHLGSILKLTDENGVNVAEQSFDAWGKPRSPSSWNTAASPSAMAGLIRGYTGHEHLPQFSLINMNGRMYDPNTARFLSADNNVQDGENTQSYNRYSYCGNNPLKYTDPTGYDEYDFNFSGVDLTGGEYNFNFSPNDGWVQQADGTYTYSADPTVGESSVAWSTGDGNVYIGADDGSIIKSGGGLTDEVTVYGNLNSEGDGSNTINSVQTYGSGGTSPSQYNGEWNTNGLSDTDNWGSNFSAAASMTFDWFAGFDNGHINTRYYTSDNVADALKNSPGIDFARANYYYNNIPSGDYSFGLTGLLSAGIDPIEQFVGSYHYEITSIGDQLQYTLSNRTSLTSAAYHLTFESWNPGFMMSMGNQYQVYIFTEPLAK